MIDALRYWFGKVVVLELKSTHTFFSIAGMKGTAGQQGGFLLFHSSRAKGRKID